ncbi:MAG: TonB-dependent receptor [Pseudomonadota bacterium]
MKRGFKWVIAAVLVLPGAALGAEPRDAGHVYTMDEVVVSATKTDERRKDVASQVIVKTSEDIDASPAKTLGEFLGNELGLDLRSYGNYGGAAQEIQIRGVSSAGTQVFVNGVNVNSPSLGTADVARIPLNAIARIEIVEGAGSLLYGSGAMGGVVNITTKRPTREKTDLKLAAGTGSQGTYRVSAENGMFAVGDLGYYLTANHNKSDGFRDNSDFTQNDVSGKLVLEKGPLLDLSVYADYVDRGFGLPGVKPPDGTQPYASGGVPVYSADSASLLNNGGDRDMHAVVTADSRSGDWLKVHLRGDLTDARNRNVNRYVFLGLTGTASETRNKVLAAEGTLDIQLFEGASVLVGSDYKDFDYENEQSTLDAGGTAMPGTRATTRADVYTTGSYAELQYRSCAFFKATGGFRYEKHSRFGSETVYRLGLIGNISESTVLKFNTGTHFRAPTINDLFWPDDGFTRGNVSLKPETGRHTDISLEQSLFKDMLFLTVSGFDWNIADKIRWAEDTTAATVFPGVFYYTPQNLDQYYGKGVEAGVRIGPFMNTQLSLDYTYLDAEEEIRGGVRRRALYSPEQLFKGTLTHWTDFDLTINAAARFVDDRSGHYAKDTSTSADYTHPEYWTLDLKLDQRLFTNWTVSVEALNLFDKGYDTYNAVFYDQTTFASTRCPYPGAGQSFFASVSYDY